MIRCAPTGWLGRQNRYNRGERPSYGFGGPMGLWARIGLAVMAAARAWVISWLVLVLIGDQSDASRVIGLPT